MSLKLLSCGRPQLNKFDGKGFAGVGLVRGGPGVRIGGGGCVDASKFEKRPG